MSSHSWWWQWLRLQSAAQQILYCLITLLLFLSSTQWNLSFCPIACFPSLSLRWGLQPVTLFYTLQTKLSVSQETDCRNEVRYCVCAHVCVSIGMFVCVLLVLLMSLRSPAEMTADTQKKTPRGQVWMCKQTFVSHVVFGWKGIFGHHSFWQIGLIVLPIIVLPDRKSVV